MSLAARLLNVFAVPGEVFEDVKNSPVAVSNWLVPMVVLALVAAVSVMVVMSQPAILQQMKEQQQKAIDKEVAAGRMTQQQADQALAMMERFMGPGTMKILGTAGAVLTSVVRVFWWAFVMWLIAHLLFKQKETRFPKLLEVAGLTMMISVLGQIVTLLLMVNLARTFASPSLGLLVQDFDVTRKSHLFLGAVNVFAFWHLAVLAIGLSRLASTPFIRCFFVLLLFSLLQYTFFILTGLGQLAL
jgi:hypothetical protein